MRVNTNIHRSANSVLELFKFVTSLALVSAVSVWIALVREPTSTQALIIDQSLLLVGFVLLLVRYYHGNSLHLLERYADGATAPNLHVALPTDSFFIMLQGIILVAISFCLVDTQLFGFLLIGLLIVDAIWAGTLIRLNQEPTGTYLQSWFLINLVGSILLVLLKVSTFNSPDRVVSISLFAFVIAHTLVDYLKNWRRYFPLPSTQELMIGAPLTAKVVHGKWTDQMMMSCITRAYFLCEQNGFQVYSAHVLEEFGAKLRQLTGYVLADVRQAKDAAVYVGITDGTQSNGMAVELGIAAACGTRIYLFVLRNSPHVSFLEELARAHGGSVVAFDDADDFIRKLVQELSLTKGQDPAFLTRNLIDAAQNDESAPPTTSSGNS